MGNTPSAPQKPIEPPAQLHIFKGLHGVPSEYSIPEITEKRKPTDQFFLILFIVLLIVLCFLSIYTISYSDSKRITNGYDSCGNVCGEKNPLMEGINCTGQDFSKEKILMYENYMDSIDSDLLILEPRECVKHCEKHGHFQIINRCFKIRNTEDTEYEYVLEEVKSNSNIVIDQQILNDLKSSYGYIVGMVFIALGLCFIMLLLFKYFLSILVKTLLFASLVVSVLLIYLLSETGAAWFGVVICVIVTVGVILSWKKLNLVIKVFNETTKSIFAMPFLMLVPIWVFLIEVALTGLLIFLMAMYYSAGELIQVDDEYYAYVKTNTMMLTVIYTTIFYIYLCIFLYGCQQMVVSGAVSTWYFTREKDKILGSPITESFKNLIKCHLGSVAFGSLVITIVKIIRLIIRAMMKREKFALFRILINTCAGFTERMVNYLSNQAYIMIAMHGEPFITSGRRATELLTDNALSTLSVNTIGDFILFLAKVFVVMLTAICGLILDDGNVKYYGFILFIGIILAALLAHSVFRNFEICVDTIFLCYCEDTFIHDGIEQPYYAPVELVAVVDEAKGIVEEEKMYNSIKTQELPSSFV